MYEGRDAKCPSPQQPRPATAKDLLLDRAKTLRTIASKLEALADRMPREIGFNEPDLDSTLAMVVGLGVGQVGTSSW